MFPGLVNSFWMKSNEIYINVDSYGLEGLKTSSKPKWPMYSILRNKRRPMFINFEFELKPVHYNILDNALLQSNQFRGFEPQPRNLFLKKSDIKWAFSYILIYFQ